jgi:D-alanyl-D-alanine carboxypeptidase/D-alanyl-D-alanine-endopeptidase (penicillin-binding protein 4)
MRSSTLYAAQQNNDRILSVGIRPKFIMIPLRRQKSIILQSLIAGAILFLCSSLCVLAETKESERLHQMLGKKASVLFVDYNTGKTIFAHQEKMPLIPASTQKLVTTWQALENLGAEFKFTTQISFDPKSKTLYLRGGLDPLMTTERLWLLARGVKSRGVTSIKKIVIDSSALVDGARDALSDRAYDTSVTAFPVSFNSIIVTACATELQKEKATVFGEPPITTVTNGVSIGRGTAGFEASISDQNIIATRGKIEPGSCEVVTKALQDQENGVKKAIAWVFREAGFSEFTVINGRAPSSAVNVYEFESPELRKILVEMNHFSSNHIAQQLSCRLGGRGDVYSCSRGAQLLEEAARELFGDPSEVAVVDGSGLSRSNQISARVLTKVILTLLRSPRNAVDFEASLPVGGERGTIKKRDFGNLIVHAKSGSLNGVSSLAGVFYTIEGKRVVFSIILNEIELERAFKLQEELLQVIARSL